MLYHYFFYQITLLFNPVKFCFNSVSTFYWVFYRLSVDHSTQCKRVCTGNILMSSIKITLDFVCVIYMFINDIIYYCVIILFFNMMPFIIYSESWITFVFFDFASQVTIVKKKISSTKNHILLIHVFLRIYSKSSSEVVTS